MVRDAKTLLPQGSTADPDQGECRKTKPAGGGVAISDFAVITKTAPVSPRANPAHCRQFTLSPAQRGAIKPVRSGCMARISASIPTDNPALNDM
ncbi:hypothetical protein NBRC116597_19240 [Phaeobacter sp. NW0010-22]